MGLQIVRYIKNDNAGWGVLSEEKVFDIDNDASTLAEFLKDGPGQAMAVLKSKDAKSYNLDDVQLASPVTKPSTITCQGANYSSHRQESGMTAERPEFNLIFGKAESSLCAYDADVVRPKGVKLLDYEIELGLVIKMKSMSPLL